MSEITKGMGFNSVGLIVGIPCSGRPTSPRWGVCLANQNYPLNTSVTIVTTEGEEVGQARNKIVDFALEKNARYVWFIDDDTLPPPFAIQRLGWELDKPENEDNKIMVIGGIYCEKRSPTAPVVYKQDGAGPFWRWKVNEVFECASIGTGCMLINTEIFKHLEKPYFKTVEEYVKDEESHQIGSVKMTDDIWFCKKVREAGFKILAHGGVLPSHYNLKDGKYYNLPEDSYPVKMAREEEAAKAAEAAQI